MAENLVEKEQKPEQEQEQKPDDVSKEDFKQKFEDLEKKHSDLNQGIAKYRDETQLANKRVEGLQKELQDFKSSLDSGEEIDMNSEDKKKLEGWAKKQGYVTKEELDNVRSEQNLANQQEIQIQAISSFLKKHSEYDTNENWQKVQKEFSLYHVPTTLQSYNELLERIHKSFSTSDLEKKGGDKARADMTTKGRLSLGGGSQKSSQQEETIENLQKKYPHLNREQIESQMSEIDALYPKE